MTIKEWMYQNRVTNVQVARHIDVDPSRVSLFLNGVRPFPKKYEHLVCGFLGISETELKENKIAEGRNRALAK